MIKLSLSLSTCIGKLILKESTTHLKPRLAQASVVLLSDDVDQVQKSEHGSRLIFANPDASFSIKLSEVMNKIFELELPEH